MFCYVADPAPETLPDNWWDTPPVGWPLTWLNTQTPPPPLRTNADTSALLQCDITIAASILHQTLVDVTLDLSMSDASEVPYDSAYIALYVTVCDLRKTGGQYVEWMGFEVPKAGKTVQLLFDNIIDLPQTCTLNAYLLGTDSLVGTAEFELTEATPVGMVGRFYDGGSWDDDGAVAVTEAKAAMAASGSKTLPTWAWSANVSGGLNSEHKRVLSGTEYRSDLELVLLRMPIEAAILEGQSLEVSFTGDGVCSELRFDGFSTLLSQSAIADTFEISVLPVPSAATTIQHVLAESAIGTLTIARNMDGIWTREDDEQTSSVVLDGIDLTDCHRTLGGDLYLCIALVNLDHTYPDAPSDPGEEDRRNRIWFDGELTGTLS